MTIAIAGTTTYENTDAATGYTLPSYTPAAGSNRILVVRVHALRTNESGAFTVDSVTFGGVALTQAVSADTSSSSRRYRAAIWYLINPSGSAGDIVVTLSHQAVGCIIAASTLTGAAQSSPVGQTGSNTTSPNASIASTETNSGAIGIVAVTSHCNNNPTWSIYDSAGYNDHTEQYDIRTASNVSTEVSGAGGSVIGPDTVTNHRLDQSQSNPQVAVLAVFKAGASAQSITPSGIATVEAFGSGVVTPGAVNVTPGGIATAESLPNPVATPGAVVVLPAAIATAESLGTATVAPGGVAITPDGIASLESIGAAVVATGGVSVAPDSVGSAESVPGPVVASGGASIAPDGIATAENVPSVTVTTGAVSIAPDGIPSAESIGEASLTAGGILPESIGGAESFGTAVLTPGAVVVTPDGITSDENVNGVTISQGALNVSPDSIGTAESVPSPLISDWRWVGTLSNGSNDAYEDSSGLVYLNTTSANVNAAQPWAAFLFRPPLPAGATVVHTYLRLWMYTYDDPNLTARAQASNSPAALSNATNDISGRTLTENGVVWSASNIGVNKYNDSPDLAAVLQEVMNLPGWVEEESEVLFVLHDNGAGGHIRFNMADNAADRPQLVVDYVLGDTAQTITVTGIPSGEAVGAAVVTPGAALVEVIDGVASTELVEEPGLVAHQTITDAGEIATGFRSVETIVTEGGPVVTVDDGIGSEEAVGEAAVSVNVDISIADGIATAESLGEAVVNLGAITVLPDGIASLEAVGEPALTAVAWVLPEGIASLEAVGAAVVAPGPVVIVAGGIVSAEAVAEALVTTGALFVLPYGIETAESVGGPVLSPGAVSVEPDSIESAESLGAAAVSSMYGIAAEGIGSLESVGEAVVMPGGVVVTPDGIGTAESVSGPELSAVAWVLPDGIATAESLGALTVVPGGVVILPESMASVESVGAPGVTPGAIFILPEGLTSVEAFGSAALEVGPITIAPVGILSAEMFGLLVVMSRFLPTVNIRRMPGKERVYLVSVKGRVFAQAGKERVFHKEE